MKLPADLALRKFNESREGERAPGDKCSQPVPAFGRSRWVARLTPLIDASIDLRGRRRLREKCVGDVVERAQFSGHPRWEERWAFFHRIPSALHAWFRTPRLFSVKVVFRYALGPDSDEHFLRYSKDDIQKVVCYLIWKYCNLI